MTRHPGGALAALTVALFLSVASASDATARNPTVLGSGARTVWIFAPAGPPRDVVVFAHGWSTPLPSGGFSAWIRHLRARGSIVIYPR